LCATLFAGCDVSGKAPIATEPPNISARSLSERETAELEKSLSQSPEVAELTRIRDALTDRARRRRVTPEQVTAAYRNGDAAELQALFGFTPGESTALSQRLENIQHRLYQKHPELQSIAVGDVSASTPCNAQAAARALARGSVRGSVGGSTGGEIGVMEEEGGCKWLQYTAALAVCTTAGPVIYWPCAYLAYCSFCSEGGGICM
jgi:hypothetical protein